MPVLLVRGTMILATVAWAAGEALMRRSPGADRLARSMWTVGIGLALSHVVMAFQMIYAWSHEAAVAATVRQTVERFGLGWRGAIYINYIFLTVWLADVCWWWVSRASHATRSLLIEIPRLILFVFMFVNGAVVFASGNGRLVGIASLAVVLFASPALRKAAVPA